MKFSVRCKDGYPRKHGLPSHVATGHAFQQKHVSANLGVWMGEVLLLCTYSQDLSLGVIVFCRKPPPLHAAQGGVRWRSEAKAQWFQERDTNLFFTLNQRRDWERDWSRSCCSSVERDLLLMPRHPTPPHWYLERNTSGFGTHAGDGCVCSHVTVLWGPQSQARSCR